jgi:hypothetical protein
MPRRSDRLLIGRVSISSAGIASTDCSRLRGLSPSDRPSFRFACQCSASVSEKFYISPKAYGKGLHSRPYCIWKATTAWLSAICHSHLFVSRRRVWGIANDKGVLQGYRDTGHAAVQCCTAFQESGKVSRLVSYRRIGTLLGTGPKTVWTH